jgi:hypothetical protein
VKLTRRLNEIYFIYESKMPKIVTCFFVSEACLDLGLSVAILFLILCKKVVLKIENQPWHVLYFH